ncbi:RAB, member RAS oncogene family-like 5 [Nesidiocoris tenuis]|uniref:RAB, member RAS oncogene family-like 5 n=1 Tax=Nesidiocoris tenuis TaxID=355587 RepID=A0ABN7AV31_9HEMI|nr:RAB, member RAS oncogene family-like 5 [Nesidiocoris tenuis]
MVKLKIIMVGPAEAGKSTIANFLSEAIDFTNYEYRPTPGVRILEFEPSQKNIEIELWDCSGEDRYESLWPVFLWNAHGVIIVYNPETSGHAQELDRLCDNFIVKSLVPHSNALLVANTKDPSHAAAAPEFSGTLASITHVNVNVVENGDAVKTAFEKFVSSLSEGKTYVNDEIGFLALPL